MPGLSHQQIKQAVMHPYNEILLINKKELFICVTLWIYLKGFLLSKKKKKGQTHKLQDYKLYDSIYMTVWKKQNCRDRIQIRSSQKLEWSE